MGHYALKNVGHRVSRSSIARILKARDYVSVKLTVTVRMPWKPIAV